MNEQKKDLGLINKDYELPPKLSGKIQLAIVVGGKNINPDIIEKFKTVKDAVKDCKIPEIDYYTCGEDGSIELVEDLDSLKNFDGYDINDDSYKNNEMAWQAKLIRADKDKKKEEQVFDGAQGGGLYDGKTYPHVLQCGKKNLFEKSAIAYFDAYGIPWHKGREGGPTGNTLSSQIACLNHLFAIRDDKEAVKALVQGINKKFVCVSPIPDAYDKKKNKKAEKQNKDNSENEKKKVYISFEVVSENNLLGEGTPTRGANCTSIDALICALDEKGNKCLIVIEWKYTEKFTTDDKSSGDSGEARMKRYNKLIQESEYLKSLCNAKKEDYSTAKEYKGSVYYKETFYQLMRQTLWAEEVIKHRPSNPRARKKEPIEADDYLHLHVVSKGNEQLRTKRWKESGKTMEETWKEMLTKEGKERYILIDPEELLAPIVNDKELSKKYSSLINYLRTRYWDRPTETTNDDNQNPSAK